jgi:hypothetical protein
MQIGACGFLRRRLSSYTMSFQDLEALCHSDEAISRAQVRGQAKNCKSLLIIMSQVWLSRVLNPE